MKILKVSKLSLAVVTIFAMASSFIVRLGNIDFEYVNSIPFQMGYPSTSLNVDANWTQTELLGGAGGYFLCGMSVQNPVFGYTINEADSRNALKSEYDRLAALSETFTHMYNFDLKISGVKKAEIVVKLHEE